VLRLRSPEVSHDGASVFSRQRRESVSLGERLISSSSAPASWPMATSFVAANGVHRPPTVVIQT